MDITPQLAEGAPLISRYGGGGFVVADERIEGHLLVSADISRGYEHLSVEALAPLLQADDVPELILFGTGLTAELIPVEVRDALDARQIGYDLMDTGAACRTFNILLMEDRKVAAVLRAV